MTLYIGDARDGLRQFAADGVRAQTCVTSPPYWGLRDYGHAGQIGLEPTPAKYVATMVDVFRLVRDVLADDATLWLNLGDSYAGGGRGGNPDGSLFKKQATNAGSLVAPSPIAGMKAKDLCGLPWRVAFALQADGWYLRSDIIWHKPNPMPESVTDRPTKAHEYLFLLSKRPTYYYDAAAIAEAGGGRHTFRASTIAKPVNEARRDSGRQDMTPANERNRRTVWTIATEPFSGACLMHGADGGSGRRASANCPVHGVSSYLVSRAQRDAQQAASQSDRTSRSDAHHDLWQQDEPLPIQTPRAEDSSPCNSDLPGRECAQIASGHSTGNHRTDHVELTSRRERYVAESVDGTGGTGQRLGLGANGDHTHESSTAAGFGFDATYSSREEQSRDRNACTCTYERIIDHFAVFPTALVEPCILAGSRVGDVVLDPFMGSGTVAQVAQSLGRRWIGCELSPEYARMIDRRSAQQGMEFA